MCKNSENKKFVNGENEEIFRKYDNVKLIEITEDEYEKNILYIINIYIYL